MTNKALVPVLVGFMLLTGCCNTILTKYQDMQCVADCDTKRPKTFEQPVIQTLQMFVGESGCWLVVFTGYLIKRMQKTSASGAAYQPVEGQESDDEIMESDEDEMGPDMASSQTLVDATNAYAKPLIDHEGGVRERLPLDGWKVMLLALPAICDICGTTLMNVGLLFVAASIYQMTRGALVLFVGLFSVIFLKHRLSGWKWASLFIVVAGVAVVGLAGALGNRPDAYPTPPDKDLPGDHRDLVHRTLHLVRDAISTTEAHTVGETIIGILMIAGAQIFTASQFVLEESIMEKYSKDPIQVVGWEGIFGFTVTLIAMGVMHLIVGRTDAGKGGYFDASTAFDQMFHNRTIAVTSLLIMISIGGFNFFGLSVTRLISATARSTIDTCRTLFIWMVSLALGWETFKWLQVLGFALLVYGTSVFNEIVHPPTLNFLRRQRNRWTTSARAEEN